MEVAYFKPESIRQTSRKLKLSTEASHRFERGVDIENLIRTSNRATELICDIARGTPADLIDIYPTKFEQRKVESRDIAAAVKRLTSLDVPTADCDRILDALGITKEQESIYVSPSCTTISLSRKTWSKKWLVMWATTRSKADCHRHSALVNTSQTNSKKLLRQKLVDLGFDEAITYSFVDTKFDDTFEVVPGWPMKGPRKNSLLCRIQLSRAAVWMRPTNLPGLLDAVRLNLNQQRRDLKLFEVGKVFASSLNEDNLPAETESLTLVMTGNENFEDRMLTSRELDFYDAKGAIEAVLEAVNIDRQIFPRRR